MNMQDFDLVFEHVTDPVDLFCSQHDVAEQNHLVAEMKEFYEEVVQGKKSITDLYAKGLEYIPNGDESMRSWFPILIERLESRLEAVQQRG